MQKLKFSITIDAPREKVWNTMLADQTYRAWADVFMPGSYYEGDWKQGSKILFLAPDQSGSVSGMVSRIRESRPHEFISIEHLGMVKDGKEDTTGEEVKVWAGACENYAFTKKGSTTEVLVEMDSSDDLSQMFQDTWPKALQKLKNLAEK